MSETRTLQFESARAVQSLYANDLKLLKTLEDSLGVKVTTREGWVKLEGETEQLDRAQRVFDQLEQARQKGVDIHKHEFSYALNSVTESRADNLNDVVDVRSLRHPANRRSSREQSASAIMSRRFKSMTSSLVSALPEPEKRTSR
jgi:phosphate starvation-inducible PhoH-like protein